MGIRKAELKEFIENKAKSRKDELRKAIHKAISHQFKPFIYSKYADLAALEQKAEGFHQELEKAIGKHSRLSGWTYTGMLRDVNTHVIGFRDDTVRRQTSLAAGNLLDRCTDGLLKGLDELAAGVAEKHAGTIAEYQGLTKLTEELTTIIDAARSGDKAFKQLQELGVNLDGFEGTNPNLPAIVKLSVDPCLLNGDCK